MKNWLILFTSTLLTVALFSCQKENAEVAKERKDIVLTKSQTEMVTKGNDLAFNLFKNLYSKKSLLVSPLSLQRTLGILQNGAKGETRKEILSVLGYSEMSFSEVNEYLTSLSSQLLEVDNTIDLFMADALYVNAADPYGFRVKESFKNHVSDAYHAEISELDFSKKEVTLSTINDWCNKKTDGWVPSILDNVDPNTLAFILNAIAFKGNWASAFENKTIKEFFTRLDAGKCDVSYMKQISVLPIYSHTNFRVLKLPYGNGAYEMAILLPEDPQGVEAFVQSLDAAIWKEVLSKTSNRKVEAYIPQFKASMAQDLDKILQKMGMSSAFTSQADFTEICDKRPLYLASTKQSVSLEVDTRGTKAGAATIVPATIYYGATPVGETHPVLFKANSPFVYSIYESSTGAILLLGLYNGND